MFYFQMFLEPHHGWAQAPACLLCCGLWVERAPALHEDLHEGASSSVLKRYQRPTQNQRMKALYRHVIPAKIAPKCWRWPHGQISSALQCYLYTAQAERNIGAATLQGSCKFVIFS